MRRERRWEQNPTLLALLLLMATAVGMGACANRLGPGGGPYDEVPPVLIKSSPEDGERNVKKKKIVLHFDEYVKVQDANNKVIISPPQLQMPRIQAIGKRVEVQLEDSLIDNTTYSIDFTDAIQDNNEGNALENFSIAFSTGDELDTMQIAGKVIDARNHEPVQGVLVGVHPDTTMSLFRDTTFLRMSRTSDRAQFVIRNMKEGSYRVFALKDNDANFKYNNPTEGIAFTDSMYFTTNRPAVRQDSVFKYVKYEKVFDSLQTVHYTEYLPNDLVLRFFTSDKLRNYISKRERKDSASIQLEFNNIIAEPSQMPTMVALGEELTDTITGIVPDVKIPDKLVTYYLTEPKYQQMDSFVVSYTSVDSLNMPTVVVDTLGLKVPQPKKETRKKEEKKKKEEPADSTQVEKKKVEPTWNLKGENKGNGGAKDSVIITSTAPLYTDSLAKVLKLHFMKDSVETPVPIDTIVPLPGRSTAWLVKAPFKYKTEYFLTVDSAAIADMQGRDLIGKFEHKFSTGALDELSIYKVNMLHVPYPTIGEMLNEQDGVVQTARAAAGEPIIFYDVKPGTYYFRVIVDVNGNGRWDTGDFDAGLQPEPVYYLNKSFELLKNWTVEENFDPFEVPLHKQKPDKLIKNKPKEVEKKSRNQQREEEMRNRRGSPMGGGMGGLGGLRGGSLGGLRGGGGFQQDTRR